MADTSRLDELRQQMKEELKKLREAKRQERKQKTPSDPAERLEYFKSLLSYEPDTGLFRWRVKRHRHAGIVLPGDIAGTLKTGKGGGYILIGIDGKLYRAHRLAWWFMTGELISSDREIDHEDRNRAHNWWSNLRLATRPQNTMNSGMRSDNTSGEKGVYWHKARKCWMAKIVVNGKPIHLGYTGALDEAAALRKKAEIYYAGEFNRHHESTSDYQLSSLYRKSRSNTSGIPGVSWHKVQQKWCTYITVDGKRISLGYGKTIQEAAELRRAAEEKYHGEFRRQD